MPDVVPEHLRRPFEGSKLGEALKRLPKGHELAFPEAQAVTVVGVDTAAQVEAPDALPADLPEEWREGLDPVEYASLKRVLRAAYEHAAFGKGRERHANDKPFDCQPIMEIGRMVGIGYQLGQAMKKAQEAGGMSRKGRHDAAKAELLGAINYLASAYLQIEEEQ